MKNKEVRGILALAVVTALSFGVIIGSKALTRDMDNAAAPEGKAPGAITEEFDVSSAEKILKAGRTDSGYLVTVTEAGYGGNVVMDVFFDESGENITDVKIVEHAETEGLGAKIAEADFLEQFAGAAAPVYLAGMSISANGDSEVSDALEGLPLTDGTYEAKTDAPDENGFVDQVTLTVDGGKITQVSWDGITEDGQKKSVMSETGQYTMTEDGLTWKEQSEALAAALIESQSLKFFEPDETGKTDTVSGVSIYIGGFLSLTRQCLEQAAGIEPPKEPADTEMPDQEAASPTEQEGTLVDAVSGATISSTAAVNGINDAYAFLQTVK